MCKQEKEKSDLIVSDQIQASFRCRDGMNLEWINTSAVVSHSERKGEIFPGMTAQLHVRMFALFLKTLIIWFCIFLDLLPSPWRQPVYRGRTCVMFCTWWTERKTRLGGFSPLAFARKKSKSNGLWKDLTDAFEGNRRQDEFYWQFRAGKMPVFFRLNLLKLNIDQND